MFHFPQKGRNIEKVSSNQSLIQQLQIILSALQLSLFKLKQIFHWYLVLCFCTNLYHLLEYQYKLINNKYLI